MDRQRNSTVAWRNTYRLATTLRRDSRDAGLYGHAGPTRMIRGVECKVNNDQEGGLAALMPLIETDPWTPDHASFWHWQPELIHALVAADRLDEAASLTE